jgi:hypothetical protein
VLTIGDRRAGSQCAELQITRKIRPDHAQYLAQWLELLKSDSRAIFTAAAKASEAAAYLKRFSAHARVAACPQPQQPLPAASPAAGNQQDVTKMERPQVLKNTSQTPPRITIARTRLMASSRRTLGPGSACRASVGVSTVLPFSDFGMGFPLRTSSNERAVIGSGSGTALGIARCVRGGEQCHG